MLNLSTLLPPSSIFVKFNDPRQGKQDTWTIRNYLKVLTVIFRERLSCFEGSCTVRNWALFRYFEANSSLHLVLTLNFISPHPQKPRPTMQIVENLRNTVLGEHNNKCPQRIKLYTNKLQALKMVIPVTIPVRFCYWPKTGQDPLDGTS
jgi:hypothetical protein